MPLTLEREGLAARANPLGLEGLEFVEYSSPRPQARGLPPGTAEAPQMPLPTVAARAHRAAQWLAEGVLRRAVPLPASVPRVGVV